MSYYSRGKSAIPTFTYNGTPLKLVTEFKHIGITLTCDGSMLTAAEKMCQIKLRSLQSIRLSTSTDLTAPSHDSSLPTIGRDRWQTNSGLPLPEFTELVIARVVSNKENKPSYAFSRSLLDSWSIRLSSMGHFFSDI